MLRYVEDSCFLHEASKLVSSTDTQIYVISLNNTSKQVLYAI